MPAGRPPKYKTAKEMQKVIDDYFANPPTKDIMLPNGGGVYPFPCLTITGLALHLGFNSRASIYEYEAKNDEFTDTIKKARLRIENDYEMGLKLGQNNSGNIFALKNFGWKDKQEVESTNTHNIKSTKKPTRAELLAIINQTTSG